MPLAFVVFAGLVQYVAWIPIGRVLFFYHFFTVLPFYLLCLATWRRGDESKAIVMLSLLCQILASGE